MGICTYAKTILELRKISPCTAIADITSGSSTTDEGKRREYNNQEEEDLDQ